MDKKVKSEVWASKHASSKWGSRTPNESTPATGKDSSNTDGQRSRDVNSLKESKRKGLCRLMQELAVEDSRSAECNLHNDDDGFKDSQTYPRRCFSQ